MQLVGVIVGSYSSIFFATPLLVTLRERTELVRTHTRRVLNRRKGSAAKLSDADVDERAGDVGSHGGGQHHPAARQARAGRAARTTDHQPDRTTVG